MTVRVFFLLFLFSQMAFAAGETVDPSLAAQLSQEIIAAETTVAEAPSFSCSRFLLAPFKLLYQIGSTDLVPSSRGPLVAVLKSIGYPAFAVAQLSHGAWKAVRGKLALRDIPSAMMTQLRRDAIPIFVFSGINLFVDSVSITSDHVHKATQAIVAPKLSGKKVVLNAFDPKEYVFRMVEKDVLSSEDLKGATYLTQANILPENYDPGAAPLTAWDHSLLELMREVKRSGKQIDLLDLYAHGYPGELVLFSAEYGLYFSPHTLAATGIMMHRFADQPGKGSPLLNAMHREGLSPDVFSPGAVIRIHGCTFGSNRKGHLTTYALGRVFLGKGGGTVCYSNVLITRDFPEMFFDAFGLPTRTLPEAANPISSRVFAPLTVIKYVMNGLEEKGFSTICAPTDRLGFSYIEPGTPLELQEMNLILSDLGRP